LDEIYLYHVMLFRVAALFGYTDFKFYFLKT